MDLSSINKIEENTGFSKSESLRMAIVLVFMIGIMLYTHFNIPDVPHRIMLIVAAMIGGYMALNIGANDVANNVGPAVGSKALTLVGAILIAGVFEAAGALIAGGDVVSTIKKGIINPDIIQDSNVFIWLMMAALLAGAVWLNFATSVGAPVSTTHSIVGGVMGAGIAAGGWGIVNWDKMAAIASSWVISPVLGGLIAAGFLYFIKHTITYKDDKILAAKKIVPLLLSLMAWSFSTYLIMKGLKKLWKVDFLMAFVMGFFIALAIYFIIKPLIIKAADKLENEKDSINSLFTIPLIFAAAMLSFAHGANDVANAVGPLAAINDSITQGGIHSKASIPFWVMMVGALGIVLGLALFGPKLIRTVGSEITELNKLRAFSVAMAASITVIIASQLGLPVSSTHIAVGGIFGVGFLREYLKKSYERMVDEIIDHHEGSEQHVVEVFLEDFQKANVAGKRIMLKELKNNKTDAQFTKRETKSLKKVYRQELVKRSALLKIAAAWVITVPASALLSALIFYTIRGAMLP
ncbi:inorganic phosphate transporter [Cocleimonas flava]|uniref:Phosphate transporter n=1 Tax=Cocleimonas flava TaxID=634765 RepID=A0A4R1F926_9GAMM|nr:MULTISPECIES: inorganic phosphate transporter [Cocleimonas]MEB8431888.1 inorganic phosphate transporter [Cocleimonas sp. KMM 6892]MEC4715026.1 inorganic phosphate transporter [Cocleimonas sp. KMM 6895]MEC4744160.1 inorganic phosphate transporter [Cocleimonas sp. KMM 6896]TCJ87251.1 PiT family inorganic phosphate transporter [Cocleimonas flava]